MNKFELAARAFMEADEAIRKLKQNLKRCEFEEKGDPEIGDFGRAPCRMEGGPPSEGWCAPCRIGVEQLPEYRRQARERNNAKSRMRTWYGQLLRRGL